MRLGCEVCGKIGATLARVARNLRKTATRAM
jgi:hypothetical protein